MDMFKQSHKDFTLSGFAVIKDGDVVLYLTVNNKVLKKGYTYDVSLKWSHIMNVQVCREENKPADCGCLLPPDLDCSCDTPIVWINKRQ